MITLSALTLNALFSLSVFMDTYSRNSKSKEHLSKIGYDIKKDKKVFNAIMDYALCFIPVVNIVKYFSNLSKSNGEYTNYRLDIYKKRNMIEEQVEVIAPSIEENHVDREMTLDEERAYYKELSDKTHEEYEKLVKLNKLEDANRLKDMLKDIDEYYYVILDEIDLDDLKYNKNKSIQRMLKRK